MLKTLNRRRRGACAADSSLAVRNQLCPLRMIAVGERGSRSEHAAARASNCLRIIKNSSLGSPSSFLPIFHVYVDFLSVRLLSSPMPSAQRRTAAAESAVSVSGCTKKNDKRVEMSFPR